MNLRLSLKSMALSDYLCETLSRAPRRPTAHGHSVDTRPDVNSAQAVLDGSISDSTFQRVYRWMVRQVSTTYKEPGLRRTRAWSREAGRQAPGLAHRRLVRRPRVVDGVPAPIRDLRRGEEAGHVAAAGRAAAEREPRPALVPEATRQVFLWVALFDAGIQAPVAAVSQVDAALDPDGQQRVPLVRPRVGAAAPPPRHDVDRRLVGDPGPSVPLLRKDRALRRRPRESSEESVAKRKVQHDPDPPGRNHVKRLGRHAAAVVAAGPATFGPTSAARDRGRRRDARTPSRVGRNESKTPPRCKPGHSRCGRFKSFERSRSHASMGWRNQRSGRVTTTNACRSKSAATHVAIAA